MVMVLTVFPGVGVVLHSGHFFLCLINYLEVTRLWCVLGLFTVVDVIIVFAVFAGLPLFTVHNLQVLFTVFLLFTLVTVFLYLCGWPPV